MKTLKQTVSEGKAYLNGYSNGINAVRKCISQVRGMNYDERKKYFRGITDFNEIMYVYDILDIITIVDEYNISKKRKKKKLEGTFISLFKTDYERGLTDAWECARRLTHPRYGGYCDSEQKKIFGYENSDDVLTEYSASEAIQKIKEYEEKQKQLDEFEIGDEVIDIYGSKGCVTSYDDDELCILYHNGTVGRSTKSSYSKTGRCFPYLISVLNEMEGE